MKKQKLLIVFLIFLFVISFLPLWGSAQMSPPGKEEVRNLTQKIATSTEPFLGFFGNVWTQKIIPFFLNLGEKIKFWWQKKAKFEIINLWRSFILFFEKEVVIE